jgi:hypothetical protein
VFGVIVCLVTLYYNGHIHPKVPTKGH